MGHEDIRTTMNIYGAATSTDMRKAHGKIVELACGSQQTAGAGSWITARGLLKEWLFR